jgi:hypothetical protein
MFMTSCSARCRQYYIYDVVLLLLLLLLFTVKPIIFLLLHSQCIFLRTLHCAGPDFGEKRKHSSSNCQ